MKLKTLRSNFVKAVSKRYDEQEIFSFFYMLTEAFLEKRRVDVAMHLEAILTTTQIQPFEAAIERLLRCEPIQYILGYTLFYGMSFQVNSQVLIPRPETEELVDWIIKDIRKIKGNTTGTLKILDIGTGSGCIPITLAKHLPNAEVYAMDISEEALVIAKANAKNHDVLITYLQSDILNISALPSTFDIIVSNPPYVRELEKEEIHANVLDNEPHLALFVSDHNPLIFYKKITKLAKQYLHINGALYFEINQYLGTETVQMITDEGFTHVALKKDMRANDRMIKATFSTK